MNFQLLVMFLVTLGSVGSEEKKKSIHAGFAIYSERSVLESDAYLELEMTKECKCRELCVSHNCDTYGWIQKQFSIVCRLSTEIFRFGAPTGYAITNGYIAYKYSIPGLFLGSDDKFYFVDTKPVNFSDAETTCSSRGNFRVGIYKTVQEFQVLENIFNLIKKEIWVDMDSVPEAPHARWSDGTWYNDTELASSGLVSTFFNEFASPPLKTRFDGAIFGDKPTEMADALYAVLCQEIL